MIDPWARLRGLGEGLRARGDAEPRQTAWLRAALSRAKKTVYGRRHDFASIRTPEEYRERVPLASYEDLAPLIERAAAGEKDVLFPGAALAFERTGGGSLGGKLIPYSARSLEDFRRALLPWLADAIDVHGLGRGAAYWAISPAARAPETTSGGVPVGLPDGAYLGAEAGAAFSALSAVPASVGGLRSVAEWRLATLAGLLNRPDLELISIWSPTFLLALLDAVAPHARELRPRLDAGARVRLDTFLWGGDASVLWPELKLVSAWADASSRPFWDELRARLPGAAFQAKGLLATEGVVAVPDRAGRPVLAADSGFYEFLDENGAARFAHELAAGARCEVVTTTSGGLYRYRTGDRVVCEGKTQGLPILRFVGRAGLTSDLVGEKLSEDFVGACLDEVPGFRMLVPVVAPRPGYALVVDAGARLDSAAVLARAESRLSANPQYAYARRLGQLDALALRAVRAPLERYLARAAAPGVRLGDVKIPALCTNTDWLATFEAAA
jgi:hypothetical protein